MTETAVSAARARRARPDAALRAILLAALAATLGACGGQVPTSLYLEVFNQAGAAVPDSVKVDVFGPAADGAAAGPLLSTSVQQVSQPMGDRLGTVVIYPSATLTALTIDAQGLLNQQVISQGSAAAALRAGQQIMTLITLTTVGGQTPPPVISIDFVGSGTTMAATESAGVVPATHWNSAASGVGTLPALLAADGTKTAASASWSAPSDLNIYQLGLVDEPGDARMMNGYLDPYAGQIATVTVRGLPSPFDTGGYDVYVYANGAVSVISGDMRTYDYAIGSLDMKETQGPGQNFGGTYVMGSGGAGNYLLFHGLSGSSFTLTATPGAATKLPRCPVNGLQIVASGAG